MLPAKAPQPRVQLDPHRLNLLRMLLAKLATTLGDPLRAYEHLRNPCRDAADDASMWTLFNCVSSRTLVNRPDDRWTLRSLIKHPDAAHITLTVAHRCLMARSFPMAMAEYITLYTANPQVGRTFQPTVVLITPEDPKHDPHWAKHDPHWGKGMSTCAPCRPLCPLVALAGPTSSVLFLPWGGG